MNFNFASRQKKSDEPTRLSSDEDLTEGLTEAECRKALNIIGRAGALFLLGGSTIAETMQEDQSTPIPIMVRIAFRRYMRDGIDLCNTILNDDAPEDMKRLAKAFPILRL